MIVRNGDKKQEPERVISPLSIDGQVFENKLRPSSFDEYVGQAKVKQNLKISIEAAKKRKEPLEHILLHGPAGLGKTTLANIIAKEMSANIKVTSGPALEKQGDLAAIISNLKDLKFKVVDLPCLPAGRHLRFEIVILIL